MRKSTVFILCAIFILVSVLSACSQENLKDVLLKNNGENQTEITTLLDADKISASVFYGFVKPGEKNQYLTNEITLIYEEDPEGIERYNLSQRDFFKGHAIIDEKEEWVPFMVNSATIYKMKDYIDEEDNLKVKGEVKAETFANHFRHRESNQLLAEVTIEDDYIKEIKEIDGSEIRLNYLKKTESVAENNGGNFVEYNGDVYYREYNDNSFEKSGLWDDFPFVKGSKTNMMKIDKDGVSEVLFRDGGFGKTFIYEDSARNPRFLHTGYIQDDDMDEGSEYYPDVYSTALDGSDLIYYGSGVVFAIDEKKGIAIVERYRGGIAILDLKSGEWTDLVEAYHLPIYYDPFNEILYCEDGSGEISDAVLVICGFHINDGKKINLFSKNRKEINEILDDDYAGDYFETISIKTSDKYVWLYLAGYGGSAYQYYNSGLFKIDKDRGDFKLVISPMEIDWFGSKKPFAYKDDTAFYQSNNINYYICGLKDKIYPEAILTKYDYNKIHLQDGEYFGEESFVSIDNIEYVDGNIFFTVLKGTRNEKEDIGWRYGYNRLETHIYRKTLETERLEPIYSY